MLKIILTNKFQRDLKLIQKRGYNLSALKEVVDKLSNQETLPAKNHDHYLSGKYANYKECHISPDWLLIYRVFQDDLILILSRTGTHADLFD